MGVGWGGGVFITQPLPPQLTASKWCLHLFWKKKTKNSPLPIPPQTPNGRAHFQNVTRPDPNNGTCANGVGGRVRGLGGWRRDVNPERGRECSGTVGAPSSSTVTDRSVLGHVSCPPYIRHPLQPLAPIGTPRTSALGSSLRARFSPSGRQRGVGRGAEREVGKTIKKKKRERDCEVWLCSVFKIKTPQIRLTTLLVSEESAKGGGGHGYFSMLPSREQERKSDKRRRQRQRAFPVSEATSAVF